MEKVDFHRDATLPKLLQKPHKTLQFWKSYEQTPNSTEMDLLMLLMISYYYYSYYYS